MPHPFAAFYRGKRVSITGHTGFAGGWLVAWLKLLGATVCGYGLPPSSRPNFFDATLLDRGITSVFADVRHRDTLANTFADFQPEIIFHAARDGSSCHDPVETFSTNVMGTVNILEEARLTGCVRAVVLLSDQEPVHASADLLRAGYTAAELAALSYADSFFRESRAGIAIAHLPTLIGGGDWSESRLVPTLLHGISSGEPIAFRDVAFPCFHVLEAARACLYLAEHLYTFGSAASGAWDFSAAQHETISEPEFAKRFVQQWGSGNIQIEVHKPGAAPPVSAFNTSQAKTYPGWTSALPLDEAMAWTIEWYKAYSADSISAWRTSEGQIERYAKLPVSQPAVPAASTGSR